MRFKILVLKLLVAIYRETCNYPNFERPPLDEVKDYIKELETEQDLEIKVGGSI